MTAEEDLKQHKAARAAKAAADKASFTALAKFHEKEAQRFFQKANDCDEVTLALPGAPGKFGGL